MNSFYKAMGGRTTFFAACFFFGGLTLAALGKLTNTYVALGTPTLAFLTVKSYSDNRHEQVMKALDNQKAGQA